MLLCRSFWLYSPQDVAEAAQILQGGGISSKETDNSSSLISGSVSSSEIKKLDFTNVGFENINVDYDGNSHILGEVTGAPEGTKITYENRVSYINAGSYLSKAKLEKEGYNDKTLEATLTIKPIAFSGLTYESKNVTYDGKDHIGDIQVVGMQPLGTKVTEVVKDKSDKIVTSAIEVGVYSYTATITNNNYNTLTLTATLTIKANKTDMPVYASSDGYTYFANGLDNRYIYSYDENGGSLKRIDYSSPKEFTRNSDSGALFVSGTSFVNSVKELKDGATSVLYSHGNISSFAKYSDSIYYFASNSLITASSGIYKVDTANKTAENEPTVTKIFEGKADNLAIYGSNLYFSNESDKGYIYKLNLNNNASSLLLEEKTHEFILDSNKLYCAINGKTNDYIGYLDLSSSSSELKKLTNTIGEFLTIKNGSLYYNYTDLLGAIDPNKYGIWSIDLATKTNSQLLNVGSINGFDVASDGSLIYNDTTNLHLYKYNPKTKTTTDLLDGFVAPETKATNLGGHSLSYGNRVYYLNMYAGKTLYCYDETSKKNSQVSSDKVVDFYIYDDKLYFNQVTMLANNDLYVVDLKLGSEATKISTNDVRNLVSDGTYIYGTHYNFMGAPGGISRMKIDGSEYVKFSEENNVSNLTIKDGNLYYINNNNIEYIALNSITSASKELEGTNISTNIKNVKQFIFDGDNIFYIYDGTLENSIRRTSFSSLNEGTKIASEKTNPSEMLLSGDYIVYYSYPKSATTSAGFYKIPKDANSDEGGKTDNLLLATNNTYYGSSLALADSGNIYFLNYQVFLTLGDAHFYQLNIDTKGVRKIS